MHSLSIIFLVIFGIPSVVCNCPLGTYSNGTQCAKVCSGDGELCTFHPRACFQCYCEANFFKSYYECENSCFWPFGNCKRIMRLKQCVWQCPVNDAILIITILFGLMILVLAVLVVYLIHERRQERHEKHEKHKQHHRKEKRSGSVTQDDPHATPRGSIPTPSSKVSASHSDPVEEVPSNNGESSSKSFRDFSTSGSEGLLQKRPGLSLFQRK